MFPVVAIKQQAVTLVSFHRFVRSEVSQRTCGMFVHILRRPRRGCMCASCSAAEVTIVFASSARNVTPGGDIGSIPCVKSRQIPMACFPTERHAHIKNLYQRVLSFIFLLHWRPVYIRSIRSRYSHMEAPLDIEHGFYSI